jgi:hypothetical protein
LNLVTSSPHKSYERNSDKKREPEKNDVDRYRVVVEGFVGRGIERGLGEVEESGEADDQSVNFTEGGEAKDFGGVVASVVLDLGY